MEMIVTRQEYDSKFSESRISSSNESESSYDEASPVRDHVSERPTDYSQVPTGIGMLGPKNRVLKSRSQDPKTSCVGTWHF